MTIDTLTIVGVGLIGGSIGLAARRRSLARRILGAGRSQATLERARSLGAIDEICLDYRGAVHQADLAVFCTPVDGIVEQVLNAATGCKQGTLLTDAGSTKAAIVAGVEPRLPPGVDFVGSHPLAGSEKRDRNCRGESLSEPPHDHHPRREHRRLRSSGSDFWEALGSRVRLMAPDDHDRALAATSHLPHLLAAALAGMLPPELFDLTATGFRDTTRIAAGDPALWTAIFDQNRESLLEALSRVEGQIDRFREALQRRDTVALMALLTQAKQVRDALGS